MSKLNITQFITAAAAGSGVHIQAAGQPVSSQDVTTSATSAQSSATDCYYVRLISDVNCRIAIGANPTATATSMAIRADQPEYFGVRQGDKIAVIEG